MYAEQLPLSQLHSTVRRCEAALLAGTSTHRDILDLIDAEREILRREQSGDASKARTTDSSCRSRTGRSTVGGGRIRV